MPYLTPHSKINSGWIKGLKGEKNHRKTRIKLMREFYQASVRGRLSKPEAMGETTKEKITRFGYPAF